MTDCNCRDSLCGLCRLQREQREDLILALAEIRVASLDTATLLEISGDDSQDLDAVIAACARKERKRLRKLPTKKLWEMSEELL